MQTKAKVQRMKFERKAFAEERKTKKKWKNEKKEIWKKKYNDERNKCVKRNEESIEK